MYRYSFLGGAGQKSPAWAAVKDVGRIIASAGPLFVQSRPAALPKNFKIECAEFTSYNKFYSGPAVKAYALKAEQGTLFVIINQNPVKNEKCKVTLPGPKAFDMVKAAPVPLQLALDLAPGDGAYIYCGKDLKELDSSFASRFRAERARYLLRSDIAVGFGIKAADPDTFKKLPPLQALKALFKEQALLEKKLASGEVGKILADLEETRQTLDKIEFRLCCALELTVTPEMRKATKRYARYAPHPDKKFQAIRMDLAKAFAHFYALADKVETGGGFKAAANLKQVKAAALKAARDAHNWLDNHPRRNEIDDPTAP
jgi:hypothetical protein